MSAGTQRFPSAKALPVAQTVARLLLNDPEQCCICGSLRRQRSEVGDIDIVVMDGQAFQTSWLLAQVEWRIEKDGPKYKRVIVQKIPVDIYIARDRVQFAMLKLVRTGSKEHNIHLVMAAKRLGLEFKAGDGLYQGGRRMPLTSETAIFAALKVHYVRPERREIIDNSRRASA